MIKIGETLKNKRKEKKLSLEEVYYATRIPLHILSALEEEEFNKIAGVVYVKSFLKKYADFLGLDSKEIVNAYLATLSELPSPVIISPKKNFIQKGIFRKIIIGLIALFIILIFLKLATSYLRKIPGRKLEERPTKIEKDSLFVPLREELILKIRAKKDTWIQLKADGKVVFQHTLKRGSEEIWKAKNNFELWVGEAKNLILSLNEKPLKIKEEGVQKGIIIDHRGLHRK